MSLVWASGLRGIYDYDAIQYVAAVEAADGQSLEYEVACAINNFVVGCKTDGIWDAIKASCILAGARTLSGALVPLKGTAPTNNNFVAADYDRETGLVGDGSTKYLDSNRRGDADPLNSCHQAMWITGIGTASVVYMGVETTYNRNSIYTTGLALKQSPVNIVGTHTTGLRGASRTASNNVNWITGTTSGSVTTASVSDSYGPIAVFARNNVGAIADHNNARLSFYSIGESLNLALLDARVSTLMTDIGAAIP